MAVITLGTNANNSLAALAYQLTGTEADFVTLAGTIKDDRSGVIANGAFQKGGMLLIPNRGWLTIRQGDYVGVDSTTGWPILVSAAAIASGPWTHT